MAVANRFPDAPCVLCDSPSEGVGEHVISRWLIELFGRQGPFKSEKAGVPYLNRKREVALQQSLPGVHVPMCSGCNNRLNRMIEVAARPVVARLLPWSSQHVWPSIDSVEAKALARWLLKVGLLWAHPDSHHDQPQVQCDPSMTRFEFVEREWLSWMRGGSDPPDGFTVYAVRRSLYADWAAWPETNRQYISLPRRVVVGDRTHRFMTRSFGIRGLDVTIVWHPGWPIAHPFVEQDRAAVLWPKPAPVNFDALREAHPDEVSFVVVGTSIMTSAEEYERQAHRHPLGVGVLPMLGDMA